MAATTVAPTTPQVVEIRIETNFTLFFGEQASWTAAIGNVARQTMIAPLLEWCVYDHFTIEEFISPL